MNIFSRNPLKMWNVFVNKFLEFCLFCTFGGGGGLHIYFKYFRVFPMAKMAKYWDFQPIFQKFDGNNGDDAPTIFDYDLLIYFEWRQVVTSAELATSEWFLMIFPIIYINEFECRMIFIDNSFLTIYFKVFIAHYSLLCSLILSYYSQTRWSSNGSAHVTLITPTWP